MDFSLDGWLANSLEKAGNHPAPTVGGQITTAIDGCITSPWLPFSSASTSLDLLLERYVRIQDDYNRRAKEASRNFMPQISIHPMDANFSNAA